MHVRFSDAHSFTVKTNNLFLVLIPCKYYYKANGNFKLELATGLSGQ